MENVSVEIIILHELCELTGMMMCGHQIRWANAVHYLLKSLELLKPWILEYNVSRGKGINRISELHTDTILNNAASMSFNLSQCYKELKNHEKTRYHCEQSLIYGRQNKYCL
jgi:hypothetical protein